jgi:hypothetical protein
MEIDIEITLERTSAESSWAAERHFEDQTIEGSRVTSLVLFQRLCTDPNAVNAKMKKKLSVPGA